MVSKKTFCGFLAVLIAIAIIVTVVLVIDVEDKSEDVQIVTTSLGNISGSVFQTRLDKKFLAFRGVRYAEAPVDTLRFQPPVPVKPWKGNFDATEEGPICPQPSDSHVSEDCLRLNVYTSEIPNETNPKLKPVLVFIHSGAFIEGSSASSSAGAEYLLDRDVVLVTFNYRLGSLGFMSTGTKEAPGNNGFKDQVIALRWVRDHIEKFGGDPSLVTLMGQGAGARSAMLHLISPMSQDLFHRTILMSGSVTAQWEVPQNQLSLAKEQAKIFDCPEENVEEMFECLRKIDGKKIGRTSDEFDTFDGIPTLIWKPVIEPDFGQERFLIEDPSKLFASGNFSRVPIIVGMTDNEFASLVPEIIEDDENLRKMNAEFETYAPICFMYEQNTTRSHEISVQLWDNFIKTRSIGRSSFDALAQIFSDSSVRFGVHRFVQLVHKFTPVFYYKNTFVGRYSNFYLPEDSHTPYGVSHGDDLIYILKQKFPLIKSTDPEALHLEQVLDLWTSFAATGDPNNNSTNADLEWTPYAKELENYLDVGNKLTMKTQLFLERFLVWESLFPMIYS